jgi:hypothetical protein
MRRTRPVDLLKYLDKSSSKTPEAVHEVKHLVEPQQHEPIVPSTATIRPAWPREDKSKSKGKTQ